MVQTMDEVFTSETPPAFKPKTEKRRGIQMVRARHDPQSKTCYYCKIRVWPKGSVDSNMNPDCTATKDHYVPKIFKAECVGIEGAGNCVVACSRCNGIKAWYPGEIFEFFVRTQGTRELTAPNFQRFIYKLAQAGFKAAKQEALTHRVI